MSCPPTRNFEAWINAQPPGPFKLIVTGEVETTNGALRPVLRETDPQGVNTKILLLDLSIERAGDAGTADVAFRDARFERPADEGQYETVEILWQGTRVHVLPVGIAH